MDSDIAAEGSSNERADGPPLAARAAKRPRMSPAGNDNLDDTAGLTLPPEVWADVMEYLPFQSILTCSTVSRSMLHETLPRLAKLRIDRASQMNLTIASRFRDVTDIHINSLLSTSIWMDDDITDIFVDFETKIRVVPFLSCFVRTLERLHFGGKTEGGEDIEGFAPAAGCFWEGDEGYPNDGSREQMLAFIDMISGAFRCGVFPKRLKISGLCCPDSANFNGNRGADCETCRRACKSFPLESVIHFESRQSSISNACSGRSYGLDVCLDKAQIESIIESRPGGKDLLRTDERLLRLLGSGRLYKIESENGEHALHIVKYKTTQLEEIKRVIAYAELDVKKLSTHMLQEAILKSFGKEGGSIPPKNQRHLSDASLVYLIDEIGLCVDKEGFGGSLSDLVEYAQQLASLLSQMLDDDFNSDDWEYADIEIDCLKLIRRFLELQTDPPIEQIADVIPLLSRWLEGSDEYKVEAASSLKSIFARGTGEHRDMVIDAEVIPRFGRLLESSKDCLVKVAVLALVDILTDDLQFPYASTEVIPNFTRLLGSSKGCIIREALLALVVIVVTKEQIDAMVQSGGFGEGTGSISRLVNLLDSSDEACVESSLRLLAFAAEDHIQSSIDAGVLPYLFRIMLSPNQTAIILANCSILLRKILEVDSILIQQVLDTNLVPRLVEILKTNKDDDIQTDLGHFCIGLVSGGTSEQVDLLVKEEGFLAALVGLQAMSEEATSCLAGITNDRSTHNVDSNNKSLAWGEYRVFQLVESDDEEESVHSAEEAVEVSDEQVKLEELQAIAANAPRHNEFTGPWVTDDEKEESPSLLGIPKHLLETILIYATKTQVEVNVLETVCKKFHMIVKSNDDGDEFRRRHSETFGYRKTTVGLREIRRYQKSADNEIMMVLCGLTEVDGKLVTYADELRTLATNLLSKMNHCGPAASFRLRGDTIGYLFELCQGYMLERLEQAVLLAIHSSRVEVQRHDLAFKLPSQVVKMGCDVGANDHEDTASFSFGCSCSLPSSSGIIWRWPEDDCRDVLQPDAGRRIIRRLAFKAGINKMSGSAFDLAEAELLHTLGVLLVEAYESSVQMAMTARYLDPEDPIGFALTTGNAPLPYGIFSDSIDMFYVPPPPLCEAPNDEGSDSDSNLEQTTYTIVPGQISAAAERRNIHHKVYSGWIPTSGNTREEEMEVEESFYYYSDSESSDDNGDGGGDESANSSDEQEATLAGSSGPLAALLAHPQLDTLRRYVQCNSSLAQNVLSEIGQKQPDLLEAINSNQAAFYELMSEPVSEPFIQEID